MEHKHGVRDTGAHFTIDQYTRAIKNDSANKTTIVQFDHNSEQITFEIPLLIDGHAMTSCDLIEIHFINISTDGNSQNHGTYEVQDIAANGDKAVFTWLISQNATQLVGSLNFIIVFKCVEDGVTVYRWSTEICKTLAVSSGMENGEEVLADYPDILAQWKTQLFDASNVAVSNVATAEAKALAAIEEAGEAKKQSVLDSIPDEYEALSALTEQNYRNKAGAIVLSAEGKSIVVRDASDYPLQNLKVFGKSTQDGTPTPDAPVDIVSIDNPVVTVFGKNLFNLPQAIEKPESNYNYDLFTNTAGQSTPVPAEKISLLPYVEAGKTYCFSCDIPELAVAAGVKVMAVNDDGTIGDESGTAIAILAVNSGAFVPTKSSYVTVRVGTNEAVTIRNTQLEMGETATEYEPHIEAQVVKTAQALPGIPVSSGGNYTDANGQRWICDEVDFAKGVYVQRVKSKEFDGIDSETITLYAERENVYGFALKITDADMLTLSHDALCTRLENITTGISSVDKECFLCGAGTKTIYAMVKKERLSGYSVTAFKEWLSANPLTILFQLALPIETPLSNAEINAFRALRSHKPNTTILNDAGVHMSVEYVADTKTYIDNKIAELLKGSEQA